MAYYEPPYSNFPIAQPGYKKSPLYVNGVYQPGYAEAYPKYAWINNIAYNDTLHPFLMERQRSIDVQPRNDYQWNYGFGNENGNSYVELDYNSVRQQPEQQKSNFEQVSALLGSFSGQDSLDFGSLLGGSKGDSSFNMEGAPKNYRQPVQNMQSGWGMRHQSIGDNYNSALTDKAASSLGSTIGGAGGTNQLGADKAAGKFSGFLNGSSIGGGKGLTGGGGGMSKDPSAYIEAAKDIAGWSMDIADSSKSKMSLPSQPVYHGDNVHDLYGYNLLHKAPGATNSMASRKPGFLDSFTDINKKTVKGAMDGYNISNNWVGALVGGIIGTGFGLGNTFARLATHNRDLRRIRRYNDINQRNFLAAQNNAISNINTQYNTSMYGQRVLGNYGAYGGAMMPAYHANSYGLGGTVEPQELMGVTTFNAGGQHETNPNGGVMIGIGENGRPNLVEEGEVRWNDFIFSKRVKPTDEVLKKYNTFMRGGFASYADLATHILDMHKEREDSPFDKAALNIQMQRLADAQEWEKLAEEAEENGMLPEEYQQYLQNVQAQQDRQMALGGNIYANGGNPKTRADGTPYHYGDSRRYYKQWDGGGNAYAIENFIDLYNWKFYASEGSEAKKRYSDGNYIDSRNRFNKVLANDPDAVYFLIDRLAELYPDSDAMDIAAEMIKMTGAKPDWKGGKIYGEKVKNENAGKGVSTAARATAAAMNPVPSMIFGPAGKVVNAVGTAAAFVANKNKLEKEVKRSESLFNTKNIVESKMKNMDVSPLVEETDAVTEPESQTIYDPLSGYGYSPLSYTGGTSYPRTDYNSPEWDVFKQNRNNPDIVNAFTDDFNKRHGTSHTPEYIKSKLEDGIVGPIHNEFNAFVKSSQTPEVAPTSVDGTPDVAAEEVTTTPEQDTKAATTTDVDETDPQGQNTNKLGLTPYDTMRLAPAYGALRSVLEQDPPDYTYANQLASLYRPVSYRPTGQYMRYMPVDQHYIDTMAEMLRNNMYGFYRNNAMSNAAANYYATMSNTLGRSQGAQAYREAVLQNNQNRNNVLQYNNQLDASNENARMQTEQYNTQNYANIMAQSYGAAEQERLAVEAAREANRQNLYNNIGTIGRELSDRYYVSRNPALLYGPMGAYYKYLQQQK